MHTPTTLMHAGWIEDLEARHQQPERHYHTFDHVVEVLEQWAIVRANGLWSDAVSPWLAALLHDVVYVVGRPDNEARSADLVPEWVARFVAEPVDVPRVQQLILLTASHGADTPVDAQAALFLDADMAILGSDPGRFAEYERQIEQEWVPVVGEEAYREGRQRFLEGLAGGPIYRSAFFAERLEARAQSNLSRALNGPR